MLPHPLASIVGSGGGNGWEYASLAAAEASGDPWQNGNDVQITGGALFVYDENLATDGYSGLIHKYPWDGVGTLGTFSSLTLKASAAKNIDPSLWPDQTIATNLGGSADVSGGRSRIKGGTSTSSSSYCQATDDYTVVANDDESFLILDNLSSGFTDGGASQHPTLWQMYVRASDMDDTNSVLIQLEALRSQVNWRLKYGSGLSSTTSIQRATETRVWMYVKDGRWAVWKDADATPDVSGGSVWQQTGFGPLSFMKAMNDTYITHAYLKTTQVMSGLMVTS